MRYLLHLTTQLTTPKADKEFKRKQAEDAKAKKELAAKAAKGGPLVGGGIKKYPSRHGHIQRHQILILV